MRIHQGLAVLATTLAFRAAAPQDVSILPHAQIDLREPSAMAMSPVGDVLAVGTKRGAIALIDLEARRIVRELPTRSAVRALAFSPHGDMVFAGLDSRDLVAIDTLGRVIATRRLDRKPLSIDADQLVAVAEQSGTVELLTPELLPVRKLASPNLYDRDIDFVAVGQRGAEVFAAGEKAVSAYWTTTRGDPIRTSSPNRAEILSAARDPGGSMLLLGLKQYFIGEEPPANGVTVRVAPPRAAAENTSGRTRERAFSGMGNSIGVTPFHSAQIYDWATGKLTKELLGLPAAIRGVAIAPIRTVIATADEGGQVFLWNIQQNRDVAAATMNELPVGLAFSTDGKWLASAGEKSTVYVWKTTGVSPNHVIAGNFDTEGLLSRAKYEITTATEPLFSPRDTFSMAILGLNALGVDAVLTRSVDNLIAARFADYGNIRLVERDAVDRVIKEVKFQNSGLTSTQDAAKIGTMLNATRVIVGSVNQLGASVVVSLRIVQSATARIDGAREVVCNDCTAEDLPKALSLLVRAVMGAR